MMTPVPRLVNATKSVLQTSSILRFVPQVVKAYARVIRSQKPVAALSFAFLLAFGGYAQTLPAAPVKKWVGPVAGGAWTTAANWTGGVVPGAGDSVVIDLAGGAMAITSMPTVSVYALTVGTNCSLDGTGGGTTLTVSGYFQVAATRTLTLTSKAILAFNPASIADIQGTLNTATNISVTNDMTIGPSGLISGGGKFSMANGSTLRIGSPAGISATAATGNVQVTATASGRTFNAAANFVYNGTAAQSTGDGLPTSLTGSLTINNSNGVTLSQATTISTGTLNLQSGTFTSAALLTLGNSATAAAATLNRGNGSLSAASTLQGTFWYNIIYSGDNKTMGRELSGVYRNVTLNLNAGQVLSLDANRTIPGTLTLTRGLIATGTNRLFLSNTAGSAVSGGSALSYIYGNLRRQINVAGASDTYVYPVGDGSTYAPVTFVFPFNTAGWLTGSTSAGDYTSASLDTTNINRFRSVNRTWTFDDSSMASNYYSATLQWGSGDQDANFSLANTNTIGLLSNSGWRYATVDSAANSRISFTLPTSSSSNSSFGTFQVGKNCSFTTVNNISPTSGRLCLDSTLNLSVSASGDGSESFNYKWYNGANLLLNGTLPSFTASTPGNYKVVVSGECRTATSDVVGVTAKTETAISNPKGGALCAGTVLEVLGTGDGPISYQWYKNASPISGATDTSYPITLADNGSFTVSATSGCGTKISNPVDITINTPTKVTQQPISSSITYGDDANFQLTAQGTENISYKWLVKKGAASWSAVNEQELQAQNDIASLNLNNPAHASNGDQYKCVVYATCGTDTSETVTLNVAKATLTVTPNDASREYGEANPVFSATITGYKKSENASSAGLTGAPTLTTGAGASTPAGTHDIEASLNSLSAANYDFSFAKGTLTITPAPLTLKVVDTSRIYGDAEPAFEVQYIGFKNSENKASSDVSGTPVMSTDATISSNVGDYTITLDNLSSFSSNNYTLSTQQGKLTVNKATVDVNALDNERIYGDADPALSFTITNFKNGQQWSDSVVTGAPRLNPDASISSDVDEYDILVDTGSLSSQNYTFNLIKGKFTIKPATLTVTAVDTFRTYGDPDPVVRFTYNGFKNGQDKASSGINGAPDVAIDASASSPVSTSPYTIAGSKGQMSAKNYDFNFVDGGLTINKADLVLKVVDTSRSYGDANPQWALDYQGLKNNESEASSGVIGVPRFVNVADENSDVNTYDIILDNIGEFSSNNYSLSTLPGTLTVKKAKVDVTALDATRVYGDADPNFEFTISNFKNGQKWEDSVVTGAPTFKPNSSILDSVGTYKISMETGTLLSQNYDFNFVEGNLSITKAALVAKAEDTSRIYGDANPSIRVTYTGLKNNETFASSGISGSPEITFAATETSPVSETPYTVGIAQGSLLSRNYDLSFVDGGLLINKAPLTIKVKDTSRIYGETDPSWEVSYVGLKNGESKATSDIAGDPQYMTNSTITSGVGDYYIKLTNLPDFVSNNYSVTTQDGALTIIKATVTVTALDASRIYGDPDPQFEYTVTNFKNSETWSDSVVKGAPQFLPSASILDSVGEYDLLLGNGSLNSDNYDFALVKGKLTITKAQLTVKAGDTVRIYGDENPIFRAIYNGFKNGETLATSRISGEPQMSSLATRTSDVSDSTHTIYISNGTLASSNYALNFLTGRLKIDPATLNVKADDTSKVYGDVNPEFTATFTGFKNSQQVSDGVFSGTPAFNTSAGTTSGVDTYTVTPDLGSLQSQNYVFTYASGVLTINKALLTLSGDTLSKSYGAVNPTLTYKVLGLKNADTWQSQVQGEAKLATSATELSPVGPYLVTVEDSSLSSANYHFAFLNGLLNIDKASITVTADNKTRVYGDANPELTYQYAGFVNGEDSISINKIGEPSLITTAVGTTAVGNVAITPNVAGMSSQNYLFTAVNGTLTITKAPLSITSDNKTRIYGDPNPALTVTYDGFKNGETRATSDLSGNFTISTAAVATTPIGNYPISVTNAASGNFLKSNNYSFTFNNGTLTINRDTILVTAAAKNKVYGDPLPAFTSAYSGYANNETAAVISGTPSYTSTADSSSNVGTYTIQPGPGTLSAANYAFKYATGVLTITKAVLTVTAETKLKIYGDPTPPLTSVMTGFKLGQDATTVTITGTPTLTTTAKDTSSVGTYPITTAVTGMSATNYSFTAAGGSLIIGKAPLTIKANDAVRTYGAANPVFTAIYNGFMYNQTFATSGLTGAPSLTTLATTASNVGTYNISASTGTLAARNYYFQFADGTLTIGKATLTVTADNKTRPYGGSNPVFTATYTGFVNSQTSSVLSGSPAMSSLADQYSAVGPYAITADSGTLSAQNYQFRMVDGILTVGKAVITVTADNKSRVYGEANPQFTATYSGFVNGDAKDAVVSGLPALATTATSATNAGSYAITAVQGSLAATNYTFSMVAGTLTIGKATVLVTARDTSRTYGASNPAFTANYNGFVNGQTYATSGITGAPSYSTSAVPSSDIGVYPVTPGAGNLAASNYTFAFKDGNLTVGKARLTVSADNKSKAYGAAVPVLTASYSGWVLSDATNQANVISGTPDVSTAVSQYTDQGTYPIRPALGTLVSSKYDFTFANGTMTVSPASCAAAGTLAVVDSCYTKNITLKFTATSGTAPYTLVINDNVYTNVLSGATFTTNAISLKSNESLWAADVVGETNPTPDNSAIEVGMKLRPNLNGQITGIRFYKLDGNTGLHIGSLWSSTGTLLASDTFTVESANGWQQVNFKTPVTVTAGVTYIASYYAPNGNYAYKAATFEAKRVTNSTGSLTALGSADGGNGVYRAGRGFPNVASPVNANYYVDVVFASTSGNARFGLSGIIAATGGCASNGAPLQALQVRMIPVINVASVTRPTLKCLDSKDGLVTVSASGCNGPLQYSFDNGASFQDQASNSSMGSGTYTIKIKDATGFIRDTTITLDVDKATWVGGQTKGANKDLWSTPANWSTGVAPTSMTHIIIPAGKTVFLDGTVSVASVQVATGARLEVMQNTTPFKLNLTGTCKELPAQ